MKWGHEVTDKAIMEFQIWKDYLQLASVVQAMGRMEISKPPSPWDFCPSPAKRPREYAMNEDNHAKLNSFLNYSQAKPGLDSKRQPNQPFPSSYNQENSTLALDLDQDNSYQGSKLQPISRLTLCHDESSSNQTNSCEGPDLSPPPETNTQGGLCCFCKHNGESRRIYTGHSLKDRQGRIICPVLRMYTCSLCGATGETSHTKKYCPLNKDKSCLYKKNGRNSAGHKVKR